MTPERKRGEALRRAMPVSRMVDYGLAPALADEAHHRVAGGGRWEDVLTDLADRARDAGDPFGAAVAMNFAQMASNFDTADRVALFRRGMQDFVGWTAQVAPPVVRYQRAWGRGRLFGWRFPVANENAPVVIVVGGMSGWANSFTGMARALNRAGIGALLLDGPGQGETRITGGLGLQDGYAAAIRGVVDDLLQPDAPRVGIWGNSVGGLFAAASARDDNRIAACCINGAPAELAFPEFRTAREQMAALFGAPDVETAERMPEVAETFRALSFDGQQRPLACPVLVCEGGADPLVPPGSQQAFLTGNSDPRSALLRWDDGEHTIYNHAAERNARVSAWFGSVLKGT